MNIIGAIIAGLVATGVFSLMMTIAPRMGMPKMAIWDVLGSMFNAEGNTSLGWVMHIMMGTIFAIIYIALWNEGIGSATVTGGIIFGAVHFLIAGIDMGIMPMIHAGMKAGTTPAPGFLMLNSGVMGLMGGLLGHIVFGIVVVLVYNLF